MKAATNFSEPHSNEGFLVREDKEGNDFPIILILEDHRDYASQVRGLLNNKCNRVITINSGSGLKILTSGSGSVSSYPTDINNKISRAISSLRRMQQRLNKKVNLYSFKETVDLQKEEFVQRVEDIVEENINDSDFNVVRLCEKLGISRMQLHRKLKEYTGQSTSELILSIRLKRAAKMLRTSKMKVIEVMYETGIESCSYFTKAFKSQFSYTPSEYASYYKHIKRNKMSVVK